jgi:murein DD-endopeptidase MepM/ murein hydrolase activator NlpD
MFGSTVLEVAIGMVFVFLLTSLVCSGISDRIADGFSWRARDLENGIRDLLLNGDQDLVNKLYNNPLIQSLSTIKVDKVPMSPQKKAALQAKPILTEPDPNCLPINIPARTFVLAMFDAFVPKDAASAISVTELRTAIQTKMPDSVVKSQLLALVTEADEKIESSRKNVEQWFNAAEAQMTKIYKENMWKVSFYIGIAVAVIFNIDAAAIASTLWRDPTLRSAVVAQATEYANKNQSPANASSQAIDQINSLNLPIGWGSLKPGVTNYGQCLPINFFILNGCYGPTDWVNWLLPRVRRHPTKRLPFHWVLTF